MTSLQNDHHRCWGCAVFISPHGFGHAARAAAVMSAMARTIHGVTFHIFTSVPAWFFEESVGAPFVYHPMETDVGFTQTTPMDEDPAATLARLDHFYPLPAARVRTVAQTLAALTCRLVLCDIAPMGIAVAAEAGLPSVLVENFTWDWMYAPYVAQYPGYLKHIEYLAALYARADIRIQARPVCEPVAADLTVDPVSRPPRRARDDIRRALAVAETQHLVVMTISGAERPAGISPDVPIPDDVRLAITGCDSPVPAVADDVIRLPRQSPIYHPDLIGSADAVIGKNGYSTLAEVFHSGAPFGYFSRPHFRETPAMEAFMDGRMPSLKLDPAMLANGSWARSIPALLAMPCQRRHRSNGAAAIAEWIAGLKIG